MKEKLKEAEKGRNLPGIFCKGKLAKVKRESALREREYLSKTSLKDLIK